MGRCQTGIGTNFSLCSKLVSALFPELDKRELGLMTRPLLSSVHGMVLLGPQKRISDVTRATMETMIAQILSRIGNG